MHKVQCFLFITQMVAGKTIKNLISYLTSWEIQLPIQNKLLSFLRTDVLFENSYSHNYLYACSKVVIELGSSKLSAVISHFGSAQIDAGQNFILP